MKKLLIPTLALAALVAACNGGGQKMSFQQIDRSESFKLDVPEDMMMDRGGDCYSTATVKLTVPVDVPEDLKNALLDVAFPEDTVSSDWDTAVGKFLGVPADFGQTSSEKVESVPDSAAFLLTKNVEIDTLAVTGGIRTFAVTQSGYLGGAHDYFSKAYVDYDLKGKKVVLPEDVVADSVAVAKMIVDKLVKDNGVASPAELEAKGVVFSVADVKVPANFYPEGDSIVFYYNPYEISSWAQGEIKVALPVAELAQYMTEYGKSLFQKK